MFGRVFEKTWNLVAQSLKLRNLRQELLASNVANVDTPGYRRKDIPFRKLMEAYLGEGELPLRRTRAKHLSQVKIPPEPEALEAPETGTPNNVSLEEEMSRLMENHLLSQATLQALKKEIEMLREALTEGGK
ncbi:flagellar basal body rod protein FlgB [Thermosulfurimonas marina]|uniref:Flagellar basal body rod protein FlgB n=1 Tax=Thermosulfurimonas marina TaxID=2047767 RepID=A0A6H1WUI2_9BACT|nr:flagellar basal body rod protein FlgB [Thermosulfurimonas marina]QJA06863.1 flagellar basal body rod protein FlgB [Thermosulfurimonas marina]